MVTSFRAHLLLFQLWKVSTLPLVLFLLSAAWLHAQDPAPAHLSGQILPHPDIRPRLYLVQPLNFGQLYSSYEGRVLDSVDIQADGHFEWRTTVPSEGVYFIFIQPKSRRFLNEIASPLRPENFIAVYLEPGTGIQLTAQAEALAATYTLQEGDSNNRLLAQLRDFRRPWFAEMDQFQHKKQEEEDPEKAVFFHGTPGEREMNRLLEQFLDTTQAVWPALLAVRYHSPDDDYRDRPEFFVNLSERLQQSAPANLFVAQFARRCSPENLPVLIGETAPPFALPDSAGNTITLDSLHGRLILLDFWASWCAPCRKEAREVLRPLYDRFHDQGLEILGVSIDKSRPAWLRAIEKDGAIWPQACDLQGDETPIRQELKFVYIPANYLLDAQGRLLARNLHGEELIRFVEGYFK